MKWLVGEYVFTAPFSLKSSLATSSGGKTNILPTMFSVKMALINASFQIGLDGEEVFEWVKPLKIYFKPPKTATVQNAFVKILKESRKEVLKENPNQVFTSSIALREYVIFDGLLSIAIDQSSLSGSQKNILKTLMVQINQLGKRGCFVQFHEQNECDSLNQGYTFYLDDPEIKLSEALLVQHLDDMGIEAKFAAINNFDKTNARIGRDRLLIPVGIPYRLIKSSRAFTLYEREE